METSQVLPIIIGVIFAMGMITITLSQINEVMKVCIKEEQVYYRIVGIGGIWGGTKQVETTKENADGIMTKCIEYKQHNFFDIVGTSQDYFKAVANQSGNKQ